MKTLSSNLFDRNTLEQLAEKCRTSYVEAKPFPHIVFEDFLSAPLLDEVINEFPNPSQDQWLKLEHNHSKKLACNDLSQMGDVTRFVLSELNSSPFINFLEKLTDIQGLIPDPHLVGGGLHRIERGGFLGIHADFNKHEQLRLDRRLNLLVYLNKDWKEEYGGHLQLWTQDMSQCVKKVLPVFNRCVLFSTTDFSYHGHPEPLNCPEGWARKSLALYYYTNGRPAEEMSNSHNTLYRKYPHGKKTSQSFAVKKILKKITPPVLIDFAKFLTGKSGS